MHKQPCFRKKQAFLILTKIFFLRINHILKKAITFSKRTSKILGNATLNSFPDFADGSSYLTFKLSALKKGCEISFKLQMSQILTTLFEQLLQRSTK